VGVLEIPSRTLAAPLPAASLLDVTIDLDRGGRLTASARVAQTSQVFDQVIHLVAGSVPVEELKARLADLGRRVATIRGRAFHHGVRAALEKLTSAESILASSARDEEYARGGDLDAAEKVRRQLVDLDALIAEAEALLAWPDLDARAQRRIAWAVGWVGEFGTPDEKKVLSGAIAALEKASAAKNTREIDRQMEVLRGIGIVCWLRSPGAWEFELDDAASRATAATDPRKAARLVDEGRAAAARNDDAALERAVRALWQILPAREEDRLLGHSSGVR
jgi:molecular chaperone DnaK